MTAFVDSPTEERNPRTLDLDVLPTLELVQLINDEDATVPAAVRVALPDIARLIDASAERVRAGGVVHYVGAGTSGRLAILDAAELPPTFNLASGTVVAHMAGGRAALEQAVENAEDDADAARTDLAGLTAGDVVIGLAASGRTPYVGAALTHAREVGALTALITSNPRANLFETTDIRIVIDTGPEALTGSTRMKSGTAQKLALHTFSTGLMVRLGRTWSNLMVSVRATNEKLRARTLRILAEATGADATTCASALADADGDLPVALVAVLTGHPTQDAATALAEHGGSVRAALAALESPDPTGAQHTTTSGQH